MASPVHHPAGTRIAHSPGDNTKPYKGDGTGAGGSTLTITYISEGEQVLRVYAWTDLGGGVAVWVRDDEWRRNYYDDGTYTVHQGSLLIESGTYTT